MVSSVTVLKSPNFPDFSLAVQLQTTWPSVSVGAHNFLDDFNTGCPDTEDSVGKKSVFTEQRAHCD
jgi:hypothetical protein